MYMGALGVAVLVGQAAVRGQIWLDKSVQALIAAWKELVEGLRQDKVELLKANSELRATLNQQTDLLREVRDELRIARSGRAS